MALFCHFLRSTKLLEYHYFSCPTLKQESTLNTSIVLMHNSSKVKYNGSYTHVLTYHWNLQLKYYYTDFYLTGIYTNFIRPEFDSQCQKFWRAFFR